MLTLVTRLIILLASLSVLLSLVSLAWRLVSARRERRIGPLRDWMLLNLGRFLDGSLDLPGTCAELGRDRDIALGVLVEMSGRASPEQRPQLHKLFRHFNYADDEFFVMHDPAWTTRAGAATRLGFMGEPRAVPYLAAALNDEMLDVRLAAARALAHMHQIQMITPILESLALPGDWPLQRATEILCTMGDAAIEPLLAYLRGQDSASRLPARLAAVRTLGFLHAIAAGPLITVLLKHQEAELRACSARALGQLGDARAADALCELLRDPAWEVRSAAAQALGLLKNGHAVAALNRALADPAWWVRFNAAQALYELGNEGRQALNSVVAEGKDRYAHDISRQILEEHAVAATGQHP